MGGLRRTWPVLGLGILLAAGCSAEEPPDPVATGTPEPTASAVLLELPEKPCALLDLMAVPGLEGAQRPGITDESTGPVTARCRMEKWVQGEGKTMLVLGLSALPPDRRDGSFPSVATVTDAIGSGECRELSGVEDIACWQWEPGFAVVKIAKRNVGAHLTFRFPRIETERKAAAAVKELAAQISRGIG